MSNDESGSDLAAALNQFDKVDANVVRLEQVWRDLIVDGSAADLIEHANLVRAFGDLASALPAIDGFRITAMPMSSDEIAQIRFEAMEVGELDAHLSTERAIEEPGAQVAEYRYRLDRARRTLVREHVADVVRRIDGVLLHVVAADGIGEWQGPDRWRELSAAVTELDRLVGGMVPGHARWGDLRRHLRFAQSNDLSDIATFDWPSVRAEVQGALYGDRDPIPVSVDDLDELVRARPTGPVTTQVDWARLSAESFERLIFELVHQSPGYENVNWLMRTNAPDRGRDIEAYRVVTDALAGTQRYRVIFQCKHWLQKSVGRGELIECVESIKLWEPPIIDVLVVATTGRFSEDAVAIAEKRREERARPAVELWPDSHLETLLARRPAISASLGLR